MRPCLDAESPADLVERGRCPRHERLYRARQGSTAQRGYGAAHQASSRNLRAMHVAEHGPLCPGYGAQPPHYVDQRRLVADHLVPGVPAAGYRVLCVSCNTARANVERGWSGSGRLRR